MSMEIIKRTIFDMAAEVANIENEIADNGGEITPEIEIRLHELQIEEQTKLISVAGWVKRLQMEYESVKEHKKEISERMEKLDSLVESLKIWLWKGAQVAGVVKGNSKDGWTGEKISSPQLTLSWRRSEGIKEDVSAPGYEEMMQAHLDLYHLEIDVDAVGASIMKQLVESGAVTIKKATLSKTKAEAAIKNCALVGISQEKRINPQIKA